MAFNTALSGLKAASTDLGVIGNNVANASTTGFKQSRAEFSDVYASSSLGVSSTAAGTGVRVGAISQQFTNGPINATDRNLDLAIKGTGFFVLNAGGAKVYSRAGAFQADKDGYIVNSSNQRLTGYQTDNTGSITGTTGDLRISNASIQPKATQKINTLINLDNNEKPKSVAFQSGFTPNNPPDPSTFNDSTQVQVFDSLGNSHTLTSYYVKTTTPNVWHVHIGIDGQDVTPDAAPIPNGGLGPYPQLYPPATPPALNPSPYTLVFDDLGAVIPNNPANPASFYGSGPQNGTIPPAGGPFNAQNTLLSLNNGDLIINGVNIQPPQSNQDTTSTTDIYASSVNQMQAINAQSSLHGVVARAMPTTVTLTFDPGMTYPVTVQPGDLVINGIDIAPTTTSFASAAALVTAMNLVLSQKSIEATQSAGPPASLSLVAANGGNISMNTNGLGHALNFTNLLNNTANSVVQKGYLQLSTVNTNNNLINVTGAAPTKAGLTTRIYAGNVQSSSDVLSIPNWAPGQGAMSPQSIDIDIGKSTQFSSPFSITSLNQDGYTAGQLSSVGADASGVITARYTNSQSQQLGQICVASFSNEQGLAPLGNTGFAESFASGIALVGRPGNANLGQLQAGALEDSNVQLTDELVKLIVAQRNFQANAQTIKTEDAITQTIINLR